MNIRRITGWVLQTVGVFALLAIAAFGVFLYRANRGYQVPAVPFSRGELESALSLAGVDIAQPWSTIASSKSARSFAGDHFDYACVQLDRFDERAFEANPSSASQPWERGAEANPLMQDAVQMALESARQEGAQCMPEAVDANSDRFARNLWRITFNNRVPTEAVVFLYEPATKHLFYIDFAT